jgi:orotate phosphoribosyltransferase
MESIATLIDESGAVRRGNFALSDGSLMDYYIDKYVFETDPDVLDEIASTIANKLAEEEFDLLAGPGLGAVPLVTAISLEIRVPTVFVRSGVDHRGTQARIEGEIHKGQRIVLVDDVSMTGETVLETARMLENAGGTVDCIVVVVDRNEGAVDRITEAGYDFSYLAQVGEDLQIE